jgi:phosphatidylethanolamine-binding protein (PEBP) family uncharacterized protein
MKVLYNNSEIKNGAFLTPLETRLEPKVKYRVKPNTLYTLIMHDPDAVGGNLLHWVTVNIDGQTGDKLLQYKGPAPPKGSGTHRYILLLYEQGERINARLSERSMSMAKFYEHMHTNLHPISTVYFTSKNQDGGRKRTKRTKRKKTHTRKRRAK